jgi:hypothetical protein
VGVLLLGALVISIVDRWRKRSPPERLSTGNQLAHFQALYDRGELSAEEFSRLRSLLRGRLVREMEVEEIPPEPPARPPAADGPTS